MLTTKTPIHTQMPEMPTKRYDLMVVLGNGFDETGGLPDHVKSRLGIAQNWYRNGVANDVAVCGKWSRNFDIQGITPPHREADLMAAYLEENGCPPEHIHRERNSTDTIQNLFNLKTETVMPHGHRKILLLCPSYVEEKNRFLFQKIFGPGYEVDIRITPSEFDHDPEVWRDQDKLSERQRVALASMKDGDHNFLANPEHLREYYAYQELDGSALMAMGRRR